ncbi:MAG: DNA-binding response regulator, partial [Caldilineae bacterium]
PGVPIIAICLTPVEDHPFTFDGMIQTPVQPRSLQAVLRAVLHRYQENILQVGPIRLNVSTRVVQGPKGRHQLSPKQSCLLQVLMHHQGETVSRGELMWQVWQTRFMDDTRTLDVHVRWLREKIEPDPSHPIHLITVRGKGYRLVV